MTDETWVLIDKLDIFKSKRNKRFLIFIMEINFANEESVTL